MILDTFSCLIVLSKYMYSPKNFTTLFDNGVFQFLCLCGIGQIRIRSFASSENYYSL